MIIKQIYKTNKIPQTVQEKHQINDNL